MIIHLARVRDMDKEKTLKSFDYYLAHQDEMVKLYDGKVIAIKGTRVLGVYDSHGDALRETSKSHQPGTFIIQKVSEGDKDYTIYLSPARRSQRMIAQ